ncbi:MAG: PQQ-binding-like beta-propeller repeat protein [Christensenellales bacterium]
MRLEKKKITTITVLCILALLVIVALGVGLGVGLQITAYSGCVVDSQSGVGIEGVAVTDGKNVVTTDSQGNYKLAGWYKSNFVTITIPSGYWTEDYYLRPQKGKKSYDFVLEKKQADQTNHNFLHITDTEIGAGGAGPWLEEVKQVVDDTNPAFIMHTGDICYEDGLRTHLGEMNSDNMGVPVRYAIGNHDYVGYGQYGEQLFEEIYGPVWYSFDVGNIHYVVTPIGKGDHLARYTMSEVWRWLDNDLQQVSPDKKVVIFNHDVPPDETNFVLKYGLKKLNMREKNLIAWVAGHWHSNFVNNMDGVYSICTTAPGGGGIDSTVSAVRTLNIQNDMLVGTQLHYMTYEGAQESDPYDWQITLGGNGMYSTPLVHGNNILVATTDDNFSTQQVVKCVSQASGEVLWGFKPKNSIRNDMAISGNCLLFQDIEGIVYCLDATTGVLNWKKDIDLKSIRNTAESVAVKDNIVYCGDSSKVVALNVANGDVVWKNKLKIGEDAPFRMTVVGDTLFVGAHWRHVVALNANNGKTLWKSKKSGIYTTATPYFYDGKMLAASNDTIFEVDVKKGKTLREKNFEGYGFNTCSTPYVEDGVAYYSTSNKGIVAINLSDFSIKWECTVRDSLINTSPYQNTNKCVEGSVVTIGDSLYFGASDGYVYKVDKATGIKQGEYFVGASVLSRLTVVGDNIFICDFEGRLTKINKNFVS